MINDFRSDHDRLFHLGIKTVTAAGATVKDPAHGVADGRLVATVTDPDGNGVGLRQGR